MLSALRATRATTTVTTGISQVFKPCACSTLAADETGAAGTEVEVEEIAKGVAVELRTGEDWLGSIGRVGTDELLVALGTSTEVGISVAESKGAYVSISVSDVDVDDTRARDV